MLQLVSSVATVIVATSLLSMCAQGVQGAQVKADVNVPKCPSTTSFMYDSGIPKNDPSCPKTEVTMCYTQNKLKIDFTAYDETNFYFDPKHKTNDDIWAYEVVEAFIYKGTDDPQTYFEYEASPNNVTFNAFIYNPSRTRASGSPFDHAYVEDPIGDGFEVNTVLDKKNKVWKSHNVIPLGIFNGESPKGSVWRMNFFRTVTSPKKYPDQQLCGWKNTKAANFHITKAFGTVAFV
ncbi:hypothetical protein LPJ57_004221 [Coemansia sp. RSA 486]|nr:hypothetical protein LPJ57_004221 [Coemansia sp. RSA 486]KAJ2235347.1 hypothetical protein IWW45_002674 [Coemansia sp. RSA 485]